MTEIEELVRSILGDDVVQRVEVRPEVNVDNENILVVEVVFDDKNAPLSGEILSMVTDRMWELLSKETDGAFPVTSFISKSDAPEFYAA